MEQQSEYFCAGTKSPTGTTKLLVIRYYPDYRNDPERFKVKFPGGTQKPSDIDPVHTLIREMREEVLARDGVVTTQELVFTDELPDHKKHFFLVGFLGNFRSEPMQEESSNGRVERLGVPFYMDVRELWYAIHPGHRAALKAIIRYLAALRSEWAWAAQDLAGELAA